MKTDRFFFMTVSTDGFLLARKYLQHNNAGKAVTFFWQIPEIIKSKFYYTFIRDAHPDQSEIISVHHFIEGVTECCQKQNVEPHFEVPV